jgi:hypothetical protein
VLLEEEEDGPDLLDRLPGAGADSVIAVAFSSTGSGRLGACGGAPTAAAAKTCAQAGHFTFLSTASSGNFNGFAHLGQFTCMDCHPRWIGAI